MLAAGAIVFRIKGTVRGSFDWDFIVSHVMQLVDCIEEILTVTELLGFIWATIDPSTNGLS